jgi:formate hydrogenlyase subunit 6/NADH:ubiquinone oxidoreductase subunit I
VLFRSRVVELVCSRHPAAEDGPAEATAVVRTDRCLAALGPSVYVWLLGGATEQIVVRLDACPGCPTGKVQPQIERGLTAVRQVVPARDGTERVASRVVSYTTHGENWKQRLVVDAKNPPISRRDLFRVFASEGPKLAAQALPFEEPSVTTGGKTPPQERRRLLNAIKRMGSVDAEMSPLARENGLGLTLLSASSKCTACSACARICPTGALRLVEGEDRFSLNLTVSACTGCGVCLDVCEPKALQRDGAPSMALVTAPGPLTLQAGALRKCSKCGAKYAGETEGNLCPICEYRRQNPFGSWRPPGIA